jgi:hypothetical protein
LLDTDIAKRKFPEFEESLVGSDRVQNEAAGLMYNGKNLFANKSKEYTSVLEYCIRNDINFVSPRTGKNL